MFSNGYNLLLYLLLITNHVLQFADAACSQASCAALTGGKGCYDTGTSKCYFKMSATHTTPSLAQAACYNNPATPSANLVNLPDNLLLTTYQCLCANCMKGCLSPGTGKCTYWAAFEVRGVDPPPPPPPGQPVGGPARPPGQTNPPFKSAAVPAKPKECKVNMIIHKSSTGCTDMDGTTNYDCDGVSGAPSAPSPTPSTICIVENC